MEKELKRLQQKRAELAKKMCDMVDKARTEDRGFTSEERTEYDAIRKDLEDLDQRIEDLKEAIELKRSIEQPLNPLPPETREYELDDFGNPIRPKASKDERQDKEQQYHDVFIKLLRSGQPGMTDLSQEERKILRDHWVAETREQGTSPNSAGGYLIPVLLQTNIIETMKAYGGIRTVATILNTSAGEELQWPTNDDTENEGELVAEHDQVAETEFEFGQKTLGAYKYSSKVVKVSIELLQDSAFGLDGFITRQFGKRLGRITSKHYATGNGVSQPEGLMPAATVGHTSTSTTDISYSDLLHLKHSVDPWYRNSKACRWMMNDSTLLTFKEMLDVNGRPLWKPSIADGTPALIDGDPYIIDQGLDSIGTGTIPMAYGDMSEFTIRDVMGFTMHRMTEKYIDYGQIGFLAFMRTDSGLMDTAAVRSLSMAASYKTKKEAA